MKKLAVIVLVSLSSVFPAFAQEIITVNQLQNKLVTLVNKALNSKNYKGCKENNRLWRIGSNECTLFVDEAIAINEKISDAILDFYPRETTAADRRLHGNIEQAKYQMLEDMLVLKYKNNSYLANLSPLELIDNNGFAMDLATILNTFKSSISNK